MPVPEVDASEFELQIEIEGSDKTKTFKLDDIYALPKYDVTATIMCGGNRRSEMTQVKPVKGLSWGMAAVGNAVWSGPRLCDILKAMGIESNEKQHVHVSVISFALSRSHLMCFDFVTISSRGLIMIQRQHHTPHQFHWPRQWIRGPM